MTFILEPCLVPMIGTWEWLDLHLEINEQSCGCQGRQAGTQVPPEVKALWMACSLGRKGKAKEPCPSLALYDIQDALPKHVLGWRNLRKLQEQEDEIPRPSSLKRLQSLSHPLIIPETSLSVPGGRCVPFLKMKGQKEESTRTSLASPRSLITDCPSFLLPDVFLPVHSPWNLT